MKKITDATEEDKSHVLDMIKESLENSNRKKLCILFGAGASVSGGIDLADKIAADIRKDKQYSTALRNLKPEDGYPQIMARLSGAQRRQILAAQIEKADINWAHLMLAEFLAQDAADRLLTVNFDPLLLRAAGLVGTLPAVYDFSLSTTFNPSGIQYPAVFYLHGQHTSFVQLHTDEQVTDESRKIEPIITDCIADRPVLVIGYSGFCDPVFEALGRLPSFDNRLFWIGYKDGDPPEHVRQHILSKDGAHWIKGFDADQFLVRLADRLGYFPPKFLKNPFSFLNERLSEISDFPLESNHGVTDPIKSIEPLIEQAIALETPDESRTDSLSTLLMLGKYDAIISSLPDDPRTLSDENIESAAWAYIMKGNALDELAKQKQGPEAEALFQQAIEKYAAAIEIKPDKHEALNNWGNALDGLAKLKQGPEAEALFQQAFDKYAAAIEIKPDLHEALNNWGIALYGLAKLKQGPEAEALFQQAFEKYAAAIEIKPDMHEALNNWGVALADLAKQKQGPEAEALFQQAFEKYAAAIEIKPDLHEALNNWGMALAGRANQKQGPEAEALFQQAIEKYAAAIEIQPDKHEVLFNWGVALYRLAQQKQGPEAEALFQQAFEKYAAAIEIQPDKHEALNNWGAALYDLAKRKQGPKAEALFQLAFEKYDLAEDLSPGFAQYNLACLYALRGQFAEAQRCLTTSAKTGVNWPGAAHALADDDLIGIRNEQWFVDLLRDYPDPARK